MKKALKTKRFTLRQELQEMRLSLNLTIERIERVNETLSTKIQILEAMLREGKTQIMDKPKAE